MNALARLDLDDVIRRLAPFLGVAALALAAALLLLGGTADALAPVFRRSS